jgi:hypothetical protein
MVLAKEARQLIYLISYSEVLITPITNMQACWKLFILLSFSLTGNRIKAPNQNQKPCTTTTYLYDTGYVKVWARLSKAVSFPARARFSGAPSHHTCQQGTSEWHQTRRPLAKLEPQEPNKLLWRNSKKHLWRWHKDTTIHYTILYNCLMEWWRTTPKHASMEACYILRTISTCSYPFYPGSGSIWFCPPANLHLLVQGSFQKDSDTVSNILSETDSTN